MIRSLVIALIVFGTIPFIFKKPFIGLLVWGWLGYMNPYRLTYGFAFNFPWVMLIAIVTLISLAISKEDKKVPLTSTSALLFAFLAWAAVSTVFAVMGAAAWLRLEEFSKTMLMVFVTLMLVKDRKRIDLLVWMIMLSIGFYGFKGGLFTALTGGAHHVLGPPKSFISDNNGLALALCMVIPLMRYAQLRATRKAVRIGLGVLMVLTGIAVLGTYSRGGLIGLVVVSGVLLMRSRRRIMLVLALVVVGATAYNFMPPKWMARMDTLHHARTTDSGETRIQSWQFAANVAFHHPFVGGGFLDYESPSLWAAYAPEGAIERAIHSIYFRTLGEQGFVGLFLYLAILLTSWRNCHKVRRSTRNDQEWRWAYDLATMLQATLLAFMASGAFLPMPYFDLAMQLFAVTAALRVYIVRQGVSDQALATVVSKTTQRLVGPPALAARASHQAGGQR